MAKKENIKDWQPGRETWIGKGENRKRQWVPYEKAWFCNTNKIIHNNEKQVLSCKYCSQKYYTDEE